MITRGQWKELVGNIQRLQLYRNEKPPTILFCGFPVLKLTVFYGGELHIRTTKGDNVVRHGHFGCHCAFSQPDQRASSLRQVTAMFSFVRHTTFEDEMERKFPIRILPTTIRRYLERKL